jgi:hypothetical protein
LSIPDSLTTYDAYYGLLHCSLSLSLSLSAFLSFSRARRIEQLRLILLRGSQLKAIKKQNRLKVLIGLGEYCSL